MIEPLSRYGSTPKAMAKCDDCGLSQLEATSYERLRSGEWVPNEGQIIHRLTKNGWTYIKRKLRCMNCSIMHKMGIDMNITHMVRLHARPDRTVDEIAALAGVTKQQAHNVLSYNHIEFKRSDRQPHNSLLLKSEKAETPKVETPEPTPEIREEPMAEATTEARQPTQAMKRQIIAMLEMVYDTDAGRYKDAESDLTVANAIGNGCLFGWVAQLREEFFGPDGRSVELDRVAKDIDDWITSARETLASVREDYAKMKAAIETLEIRLSDALNLQRRIDAITKAALPRARV